MSSTCNWSGELDLVLSSLIPQGGEVALFDFPFYLNPGDSAIAAGERSWLEHRDCRILFQSRRESLERGLWPDLDPSVLVSFQGGGNLGDLYLEHTRLLEQVLFRYPENPVVVFPQTLTLRDRSVVSALVSASNAHRSRFAMCWRDADSLFAAKALLPAAEHALAPDAAAGFVGWRRSGPPRVRTLYLVRADSESTRELETRLPRSLDWPYNLLDKARWRGLRFLLDGMDSLNAMALSARESIYNRLTLASLRTAVELLSSADVVVTDRLHGHILSSLMGIPNVVLPDINGKTTRYFRSWSRDLSICRFVDRAEDVENAVEDLRSDWVS